MLVEYSIVLREDVPGDITACMKSRYDFNHCRIVPRTYVRTIMHCSEAQLATKHGARPNYNNDMQ